MHFDSWDSLILILWYSGLRNALPTHLHHYWERALVVKRIRVTVWIWWGVWRRILDGDGLGAVQFMEGWGSWALLYLPRLRILCCMAGTAGARVALVHGVVWVVPEGEMVSVGWGTTVSVVIMVWGVTGSSIGWRVAWAAAMAERGAWGAPTKAAAFVTVWLGVGLICCHVSYVWDYNRSVICLSGWGCIDALTKIFGGGMVFLI